MVRTALKRSREIQRMAIKTNHKPLDLGVYQRMIDQVQIWAQETSEKYEADLERQHKERTAQIKQAEERKDVASAKVNDLKARIKQMKSKTQDTTRIFNENKSQTYHFNEQQKYLSQEGVKDQE